MFKKYFLNTVNILNILVIAIIMFCFIFGYNIFINITEQAKQQDIPENRTLLLTFSEEGLAEDFLKTNDYIEQFELVSYNHDEDSFVEKYEVIIDKYDNIKNFEKQLDDNVFSQRKYDDVVLSSCIANTLYKLVRVYIIVVFVLLTIINYFFISKLISSEFKSIAILKSLGFTFGKIMQFVVGYVGIDLLCSFGLSTLIFVVFENIFGRSISAIFELENVIGYTFNSFMWIAIFVIISSVIALLSNVRKIYKLSPMVLFKEN